MDRLPDDRGAGNTLPSKTVDMFHRICELTPTRELKVSLSELARTLGVTTRTVIRHVNRLRDAGWIVDGPPVFHGADQPWTRARRLVGPDKSRAQNPLVSCGTSLSAVHRPTAENDPAGTAPQQSQNVTSGRHIGGSHRGITSVPYIHICKHAHDAQPGLRPGCDIVDRAAEDVLEEEEDNDDVLRHVLSTCNDRRPFDPRLLPPYPGAGVVEPVHVPRMPRFSGDLHGDAKLCLRAYKAACWHKYGRKPRVDKQAVFRMKAAVLAMRKHGVDSPYAWAGFRLIAWQYSERRSKPPTIDYVFSRNVVDEHITQFKRKAESFEVLNRVVLTPAHRELVDLWERCRRAVASPSAGEVGECHTMAIVARILPADVWHTLVDRVPAERSDMESELYRRMAAGEWIW